MRKRPEAFPLSEFCRVEKVTARTVLASWVPTGRAPRLFKVNGRNYVRKLDWDMWRYRLEVERSDSGRPSLRAPSPRTPRKRGKLVMRESLVGL